MILDLVAVTPAVLLLDHIAAFGQVRDDAVGRALSDVEGGGNVAKANPGVVGYAHQDPRMVGEEAPLRHGRPGYPGVSRNEVPVIKPSCYASPSAHPCSPVSHLRPSGGRERTSHVDAFPTDS